MRQEYCCSFFLLRLFYYSFALGGHRKKKVEEISEKQQKARFKDDRRQVKDIVAFAHTDAKNSTCALTHTPKLS